MEDLVRHKWHANAAVIGAVYRHPEARRDEELRVLLHHILIANRFWLYLTLDREFDRENEARVPEALDPLIAGFMETEALEMEWLPRCNEAELSRPLVTPRLPGQTFTVEQAFMQIVMHSHGHRSQLAKRLRSLGGAAPANDFIQWVRDRPHPEWPCLAQLTSSR